MKNFYFPKMFLNDYKIIIVIKEKYLGAFITDDCNDYEDVLRHMRSISARGNTLIRNVKCCSEVKSHLFKTYCTGFYSNSL